MAAVHREWSSAGLVNDVLAGALKLFSRNNREQREQRQRVFEKLLELYGPFDFECWLKSALLDSDFVELVPAIERAIERALDFKKSYLASQLLPPFARFDPQRALARFDTFSGRRPMTPNPEVNVAEALRYVPAEESRARREKLSRNRDRVVADEAKRSLAAVSAN